MESASTLFGVSFSQTLRLGQAETVRMAFDGRKELNVQLPTGYGKTLTATAVYSVLKHHNRVNRLLYVVPTTAQLTQFVQDGSGDLSVAGVTGSLYVTDIGYSGTTAIKNHRNNKSQVYACMIQGLNGKIVNETVNELMKTGNWMVVIDEYHHYGNDAAWGKRICDLHYVFRLSMSATPYRMKNDSAIGMPDLVIKYKEAVAEKAVKPLRCNSYVYRVDLIENGEVRSYTTDQFIEEVCDGDDNPNKIDRIMIDREMRWSPKYVSPLVDTPISRMIRDRIKFGYPLQALVGTMSCSHAKIVCSQIQSMYPDLRVDWVGTGDNGRPTNENREILNMFCPKKQDGRRNPLDIKLDILVHVAMAGEGLDSVYVSEVIHLNRASINNTNNQEDGRAARYLEGVIGTINVDSSSPYASFPGEKIMKVIDDPCASEDDDDDESEEITDDNSDGNGGNPEDDRLPEEPMFRMFDMECIRIDDGEKKRFAAAMLATVKGIAIADLDNTEHQIWKDLENNPDHPAWQKAEMGYRSMRRREQEEHNDRSMVEQWNDKVNQAISFLTGKVVKIITNNQRYDKSLLGDVKKRINTYKAKELGKIEKDVMITKKHYQWLVNLDNAITEKGVPEWLL